MVEITQADRETTRDVINALQLRAPCTDIIARHRTASTAALTAERDALVARVAELEEDKAAMRYAINDAIRQPLGVVPDSATRWYRP
ncbi:hypothetical protein UFOVP319_23 [uncultured Caudovirales phage]|uniref:Uncharacterized protein n=1 Tax=uncultured Caudovirales phage TaxID=2100421 RepID=A0A6J5LRZ2_9CAUD|nr:hypothetical protein UFOVP319_23 [uncultured Caudovirales phage]